MLSVWLLFISVAWKSDFLVLIFNSICSQSSWSSLISYVNVGTVRTLQSWQTDLRVVEVIHREHGIVRSGSGPTTNRRSFRTSSLDGQGQTPLTHKSKHTQKSLPPSQFSIFLFEKKCGYKSDSVTFHWHIVIRQIWSHFKKRDDRNKWRGMTQKYSKDLHV